MTSLSLTSKMAEVLPEMHRISGIFALMGIAEEEIAAAKKRHPKAAELLHRCFLLLQPKMDIGDFVYRSHCRELLERVAAGEDTQPPTWAELAYIISEQSLKAPFNSLGAGMYCYCWIRAFPNRPMFNDMMTMEESIQAAERQYWKGAIEAELAALSRRMTFSDRKLESQMKLF